MHILNAYFNYRKNISSAAFLPARGTGLHSVHHVLNLMEQGDKFGDKRLELEREPFSKARKYLQI